ncbi:MAG: hypothetical protein EDM03_04725 [Porphyrobacter sp. IPPAS B-1204]|nr:MAG: hypothetical protein EDM03_04725 [Porphyrobacter sp. IPPAS B-1204]
MLPLRIPRPERADGTVLAALLAVLLALMLAAQFVLPQDRPAVPDVPPAALRAGPVQIAVISPDPALSRRSIFQPTRLAGSGAAGLSVPAGPLDGAIPAGIVRVRGAARLVLQTPDGGSVTLRPGQSWQGWRLTAIGTDEVRFARGGETVTLGLGAATESYSYPGYDPRGYQPNQADEQ